MKLDTASTPSAQKPAHRWGIARLLAIAPVAAVICAAPLSAQAGLTFSTTFVGANYNATVQSAIASGLAEYGALFSDNVNISLNFVNSGSGLGSSLTYNFQVGYQTYYNALVLDGTSAADTTALARLAVDGAGAFDPVNGSRFIEQGRAGLAAVGIIVDTSGINGYVDGEIDLNLGIMNLDRITTDPFKYDLKAVLQHEVDEVMGSISNVGSSSKPRPVDLFRYTAAGARTFTTAGDDAYFSIDGINQLARYNQSGSGDYGDWWSVFGGQTPQVQDAFSTPGASPNLDVEVTLLDVIGWTRTVQQNTVPEPGSLALVLMGLLGFAASRRNKA